MTSVRFTVGMCAGLLWAAGALAQGTGAGSDANADRETASDTASRTAGEAKAGAKHAAGEAGQAAQTAGQTAQAAGQQLTSADARTLAKLHAGNQAEVEAGTWMKDHATDSKVKDFAQKMVDDHTSMDKDVSDFAQQHGVNLASSATAGASEKKQAEHHLASIKKMQGAQADQAYMRMMVQDHQHDVTAVRQAHQQAQKAGKTELASLLEKSASKMEDHLKDARDISGNLTKQAKSGSAASTSGTGSGQQK